MTLQVYRVHHSRLKDLLEGAITGAKVVGNNEGLPLDGLTLLFNTPLGGSVTFSASGPTGLLTPLEIKAQIEAAVATVDVTFPDGRLSMRRKNANINLDAAGTANTLLGFNIDADTTGTWVNPPGGGVPEFVTADQIGDGHLQVILDE